LTAKNDPPAPLKWSSSINTGESERDTLGHRLRCAPFFNHGKERLLE
jgi:hypothetical protein